MKSLFRTFFARTIQLTIGALLLLSLTNCTKKSYDNDVTGTHTRSRSADLKGSDPNSQYYNRVVTTFKLNQKITTNNGTKNCGTSLTIQNKLPMNITISYTINCTNNGGNWYYQGTTNIAPNGSAEVGQISNDCNYIDESNFNFDASIQ